MYLYIRAIDYEMVLLKKELNNRPSGVTVSKSSLYTIATFPLVGYGGLTRSLRSGRASCHASLSLVRMR